MVLNIQYIKGAGYLNQHNNVSHFQLVWMKTTFIATKTLNDRNSISCQKDID